MELSLSCIYSFSSSCPIVFASTYKEKNTSILGGEFTIS